jgi:hypothetical protein
MKQKIGLAGRDFVPLGEATIEHDIEFMRLVTAAGLDDPAIRPGESGDEYGLRIMKQLLDSKVILPLVGCVIVPADLARRGILQRLLEWFRIIPRRRAWSLEIMNETAAFLGDLDRSEDKRKVWLIVAEQLIPFLRDGLAPWVASRRSSMPPMEASVIVERFPGGVISASGLSSSESSLATIPAGTPGS